MTYDIQGTTKLVEYKVWYILELMLTISGLSVLLLSALLITAADALIKKISTGATFLGVLSNPWMLVICALYFIQILIAVYVFINRGELAVYGNLFIVFYSVLMVLSGFLFFCETLTVWQIIGIILALAGAILLNS